MTHARAHPGVTLSSPRRLFVRHRRLFQDLTVVAGVASAERIDRIAFHPLGKRISPTCFALAGALAGTFVAHQTRHHDAEHVFAALSLGLASGLVIKGITNRWARS